MPKIIFNAEIETVLKPIEIVTLKSKEQLINALSRLCGKDNIYEFERRFERDEEDELLEVMSKTVGIQMWSKYHNREKTILQALMK